MNKNILYFISYSILLALYTQTIRPVTFTVINTNDSGAGSLRAAISSSNGSPGQNTINFNIPQSFPIINLITDLSNITVPVTIDGTNIFDGSMVTINGAGATRGFNITATNSSSSSYIIQGFSLTNFSNAGIRINASINNCIIRNNYIGLDNSGTVARPNGAGVLFTGPGSIANNITIGGTSSERNIISGNTNNGIQQDTGFAIQNLTISNNYIGTDISGTMALPNGNGVSILGNVFQNSLISSNVISGNTNTGIIAITGIGMNLNISNNIIGCNANGDFPVPNNIGITTNTTQGNFIRIGLPGQGNLIANNRTAGIQITGGINFPVLENSIYNNNAQGIVLSNGANSNQQPPVLTKACFSSETNIITISGTGPTLSPGSTSTIQFFQNDFSNRINAGRKYIGEIVGVASGAAFTANISGFTSSFNPNYITATATLTVSATPARTSTFSNNVALFTSSISPAIQFLCPHGTIQFNASVVSGTGPFTFQWTGPNGFSQNTGSNPSLTIPNASILATGNYSVTVTDSTGCQATSSIAQVVVKPIIC